MLKGDESTQNAEIVNKYKEYQVEKYKGIGEKLKAAFSSGEINDDVKETMKRALDFAVSSGLLNNLLKK